MAEEMEPVIRVKNLSKSYGPKKVLNNISFTLEKGKCLGVLGINGAGKTTMLETIEGLRKLEDGEITILGHDIKKSHNLVQTRIGIQLQKNSLFEILSVRENVKLYMGLYNRKGKNQELDALLEEFDLLKQQNVAVRHLSGGQFQRLKLCLSLINKPELLFLDEPTTGLDPGARSVIWEKVRNLKKGGTSIVITTHYMEEAEALCDSVAILHGGQIITNDAPEVLIKSTGFPKTIILDLDQKIDSLPSDLQEYDFFIQDNKQIYIHSVNIAKDIPIILRLLEQNNITFNNVNIRQANLEDVFMKLTNSKFGV